MPVKMYYDKDCPPALGEKIAIRRFARYELGEEIEGVD